MKNFKETLKDFRLKLYELELLLEAEKGRRIEGEFTGAEPENEERADALRRRVDRGLLERRPASENFAVTDAGHRMLLNVRKKIAPDSRVDWTRIAEPIFPFSSTVLDQRDRGTSSPSWRALWSPSMRMASPLAEPATPTSFRLASSTARAALTRSA